MRRKRKPTLVLTARKDGRWAKEIMGQHLIFSGTEEEARQKLIAWLHERNLEAIGAPLPPKPEDGDPEVHVVLNLYLDRQEERRDSGELTAGSYADDLAALGEFTKEVGRTRAVSSLTPADFSRVRRKWAARFGPHALDRRVQAVRSAFLWAWKNEKIIASLPHYGDSFKKPSKGDYRKNRAERPSREWQPWEIGAVLEAIRGERRLQFLLALNTGMTPKDLADLRRRDCRQEEGLWWVDNLRLKRITPRRAPLWPETAAELEAYLAAPRGRELKPGDRLFLTREGKPLTHETVNEKGTVVTTSAVSQWFDGLLEDLKIKRPGLALGGIKHSHVAAANGARDLPAAHILRGHAVEGIDDIYDRGTTERLFKVSQHARKVLLIRSASAWAARRDGREEQVQAEQAKQWDWDAP